MPQRSVTEKDRSWRANGGTKKETVKILTRGKILEGREDPKDERDGWRRVLVDLGP